MSAPVHDIAWSLRRLADWLNAHEGMPSQRHPEIPLRIQWSVSSPDEVEQAAVLMGARVRRSNGHTTAELTVGAVELAVYNVAPEAMAIYEAELTYAGAVKP
jgi:hypothetical protein